MSDFGEEKRPAPDVSREELLPCPLCGSGHLHVGSCFTEGSSDREAAVRCADCGCRATLLAWNTRKAAPAEQEPGDYECENCIGMIEHGCYCQAVGAIAPGGPLAPPAPSDGPGRECDAVTEDATSLWAAIRQRDANINAFFAATKTEEKYLLEHFDADCGIMPGDVEGSFHRLREVFYRATGSTGEPQAPAMREALERARGAIEYAIAVIGPDPGGILLRGLNSCDRAIASEDQT